MHREIVPCALCVALGYDVRQAVQTEILSARAHIHAPDPEIDRVAAGVQGYPEGDLISCRR